MGVSTYCILWSLWLCKIGSAPRGIIYWLPNGETVGDFVNTKVDPFISENQELMEAKGTLPGKKTDNQGLKFMFKTPLFFRGLKSKTKVKSISADASVFDEFDEADPSQVAQARKRTSASMVKLNRDLSTPTIPDFGINKRFQDSDQCYMGFKCPSCSKINILEHNWKQNPEATFRQAADGKYYAACISCKSKLDLSENSSKWYSTNKSDLRGYHISQLYSPFVSPDEIMKEYQTTEFIGHFHNHVIGVPYLSATDKVTEEMVLSLCDPMTIMRPNSLNQNVMGVDVGSKLHVTILSRDGKDLIAVMEVKDFEELDTIMLKYNVRDCVVDALPETRKVREFINKHKNKAWCCFYSDNQKGDYAWDEEKRQVNVNRTESMDVGTNKILKRDMKLPQRNPMIEVFATHCSNVAKVAEENAETGEKKYVYRKLGPDHFRHSLNYAQIAASRHKHGGFASVYR